MTSPKRKRETAKERDERIVAGIRWWACWDDKDLGEYVYFTGKFFGRKQAVKAAARILNRTSRSRRGKGGGK